MPKLCVADDFAAGGVLASGTAFLSNASTARTMVTISGGRAILIFSAAALRAGVVVLGDAFAIDFGNGRFRVATVDMAS